MENSKLVECGDCANSFVDHRVPADKVYCIKHRVCKWAKPKRQCVDFAEKEAKMENEKMDRRNAEEDMKVCEAASGAPWIADDCGGIEQEGQYDLLCSYHGRGLFLEQRDADFAAMAREALPHWIKRTKEAEAQLEAYKAKYGNLKTQ